MARVVRLSEKDIRARVGTIRTGGPQAKARQAKGPKGAVRKKGKGGRLIADGAWGHIIADSSVPRRQQGMRYVSDSYQPHFKPRDIHGDRVISITG